MSQFFLNGVAKRVMTGGTDRQLSNGEKIFAGVSAGAAWPPPAASWALDSSASEGAGLPWLSAPQVGGRGVPLRRRPPHQPYRSRHQTMSDHGA